MKLLLSSVLLASLCALSPWSVSSDTVVVTQTPDVSVTEGESVRIACCGTGDIERGTVSWLTNQTLKKNETFSLKSPPQGSPPNKTSHCSDLTFASIAREDSGRYVCRFAVDIPSLSVGEGKGTVITVTDRNSKRDSAAGGSTSKSLPMIIPAAAMASLLLVALACFCALRRRQAQSARVIYEVPHVDSEEAEMDKHSTSSSMGSSQWCQVPVYESFDYFERAETKESG
ncbi:uncharacterized protein [Enoplosus armatus]|uniref:uncharacterized protein n=1 Tax=Enoplosus armatus TaxID=215367 RepID=UPI0039927E4A